MIIFTKPTIMANATPFHAKTIDALSFILEDMRRKMIHHIASKIDVPEDEMIAKYCSNPVKIEAHDTIQIQGIVVQEGPVYLDPPKAPITKAKSKVRVKAETRSNTTKPQRNVSYTNERIKELIGEEKAESVMKYTSMIQEELDKIMTEVSDRMTREELFERKETKQLLKNLNVILNKVADSGLITKTQISNRMNRNITNILHGADPTKDKTLRKIAKENPKKFFDLLVNRVKNTMVQNLTKE